MNILLLLEVFGFFLSCRLRGGRVLLGILGGDVPPGSPNRDPISDKQNLSFSTPVFRHSVGRNNEIITKIRTPTKRVLKSISNSHIDSFLFIWN